MPAVRIADLQLRRDVVEACRAGRFSVCAVHTVQDVLEMFMGKPVREIGADGRYAPGTTLSQAADRVEALWAAAFEKAALGRVR